MSLGAFIYLPFRVGFFSKRRAFSKWIDDQSILQSYEEEFSEDGYEVVLTANGKEALRKYQTECPQLVILDIRMPGMGGIEVLTEILGKDRQALIVRNTAFPQYRENFMTWGAEAYLIKSSDLGELKQKVREVLHKRQAAMDV